MKYHIITIGCQMNRSDSERMRTVIDGMGYTWTDREDDAELLGVLACSVRQKAIDKVYTRIHRWNGWKNERNLVTFVTGCVLPADRDKFLKLFDFVFTMNELPQFPAMVRQYGIVTPLATKDLPEPAPQAGPGVQHGATVVTLADLTRKPEGAGAGRPQMDSLWQVPATPASRFEAYVPIQNGCDKFCTFCAVPYTRGREVSRPSADILAEVEGLIEKGYRSITLLGQNVNSYGRDRGGNEMPFPQLLDRIGDMGDCSGHEFWVYYTSPHPRDMTDELIDVMAAHACIGRQVHLPLQSGDDRVLRRMNRQHTVSAYMRIVDRIREVLPEATLFTDIIVGFTGESDAEFEHTRQALERMAPDMSYTALYSPRPGAASSRWVDDVPHEVKRERFHVLNDLVVRQVAARNAERVGDGCRVLVTGYDAKHGALSGLTEGRVNVRLASDDVTLVGKIVATRIARVVDLSLGVERVPEPVAP